MLPEDRTPTATNWQHPLTGLTSIARSVSTHKHLLLTPLHGTRPSHHQPVLHVQHESQVRRHRQNDKLYEAIWHWDIRDKGQSFWSTENFFLSLRPSEDQSLFFQYNIFLWYTSAGRKLQIRQKFCNCLKVGGNQEQGRDKSTWLWYLPLVEVEGDKEKCPSDYQQTIRDHCPDYWTINISLCIPRPPQVCLSLYL